MYLKDKFILLQIFKKSSECLWSSESSCLLWKIYELWRLLTHKKSYLAIHFLQERFWNTLVPCTGVLSVLALNFFPHSFSWCCLLLLLSLLYLLLCCLPSIPRCLLFPVCYDFSGKVLSLMGFSDVGTPMSPGLIPVTQSPPRSWHVPLVVLNGCHVNILEAAHLLPHLPQFALSPSFVVHK